MPNEDAFASTPSDQPQAAVAPEVDERAQARAMWSGFLLEAGNELHDWLPVDETGFLRVAGRSHYDARAYYLYSVADELMAAGAAVFRWMELLEKMEEPDAKTDRFWTESIADEQSFRIRKLVEILTDLINFRDTNEQPYYRHMLMLKDLRAARSTQQDLSDFYACPNANIASQVTRLANDTAAVETSGEIDLADCWYLTRQTPMSAEALARVPPGRVFSSARDRLKTALRRASADEKLALGISYDRLYGTVSGDIHFTPAGKLDVDVDAVSRGTDQCGILGLHVIVAVERLLGKAPGERSEAVRRLLDENPYPGQLSNAMTQGSAALGDFVLAYGDLAEVLDTADSEFGYRSYKVLYLDGSPRPDIAEDWFPAQNIRVLFSREQLDRRVEAGVEEGCIPPAALDALRSGGGQEAFRKSLVDLWRGGLRDYVFKR
jgi:hypothetical protein